MRRRTDLAMWTIMAFFLSTGFLYAKSADAQDALKTALRTGDEAGVSSALKDGADPNGGLLPPLVVAATRGESNVAKMLLEAGADPDSTGPRGRSALIAAIAKRNYEVMETLIAAGADVDQREASPGRSPLQMVIDTAPSIRSMEMLLDAGADIDQADHRGETALASAAFMDRPDATRLLIDRGARLDLVNLQGVSPLEWAKRQGNDGIVEMLRDAGMTE